MERQKRIAVVNDITGFGRCSVTVELPLISALKVQACPFPTAILSVHTQFPSYFIDDYTDRMRPYMESWKANGLTFDGILTGFIGSAAQMPPAVCRCGDAESDGSLRAAGHALPGRRGGFR